MNKSDLLTALLAQYGTIKENKTDQVENVAWYIANVLDIQGDSATRRNIGFCVVNEGEPDEAAYWHGSEPKPPVVSDFASQLNNTAAATVWIATTEGVRERQLFVDELEGELRHRSII